MYTKQVISLTDAEKIIGYCMLEAKKKVHEPVAAAIVDDTGDLVYGIRMDGVKPICMNLAVCKAYTASIADLSSAEFGTRDRAWGRELGNYNESRFTQIEGGVPIKVKGDEPGTLVTIGGLGISGRMPDEDEQLAEKGLSAFLLERFGSK